MLGYNEPGELPGVLVLKLTTDHSNPAVAVQTSPAECAAA